MVTKKRGSAFRRSLSLYPDGSRDQVQTITPVELSQVLLVSAWVELALQLAGGPGTTDGVTVTFCEGLKPFMVAGNVAVPAKQWVAPSRRRRRSLPHSFGRK